MLESLLTKLSRIRIVGKSPVGSFLRGNEWIWIRLPSSIRNSRFITRYGTFLHTLALLAASRRQYIGTFFLRNRPQLELIRRLGKHVAKGSVLRIAVLGCSNGAEVFSIMWAIRSAYPDVRVAMHAMDISKEVLECAQKGLYSLQAPGSVDNRIFERITSKEMEEMFDTEDGHFKVKSWIREGIMWHLGDAGDSNLPTILGLQDIVVANNFLCHMSPQDAQKVARNVTRLVTPGGYLFISGIDLDIRAKLAIALGWKPILELIEEVHDGDPVVRVDWPFSWWGLEPFTKRRTDWKVRYASAFTLGQI
ncbi:MAG: CheR family methyltransferase [Thermodesulfobacteriota bacterium]